MLTEFRHVLRVIFKVKIGRSPKQNKQIIICNEAALRFSCGRN
jgi:hypothetical protein